MTIQKKGQVMKTERFKILVFLEIGKSFLLEPVFHTPAFAGEYLWHMMGDKYIKACLIGCNTQAEEHLAAQDYEWNGYEFYPVEM